MLKGLKCCPRKNRFWTRVIFIIFPVLGLTGILQWLGLDYGWGSASFLSLTMLVHMIFALATEVLLFVHIYLKYLRNWAILTFDVVRAFMKRGHLVYRLLYSSTTIYGQNLPK